MVVIVRATTDVVCGRHCQGDSPSLFLFLWLENENLLMIIDL